MCLETVDSTNTFCLENPHVLSESGLVVYADYQRAGRGRMGRRWSQGAGRHLFASFVIHPELAPSLIPSITLCAGLAVYRVLSGLSGGEGCRLKWPNDVLIGGRKVCGILCESRLLDGKMIVVSGIGINISGGVDQFAEEISHKVTTLEACGIYTDRDRLLVTLTDRLDDILRDLHAGAGSRLFREWEEASCSRGRAVRFTTDGHEVYGTVDGLDDLGRLMVRDSTGDMHTVLSGEVKYC